AASRVRLQQSLPPLEVRQDKQVLEKKRTELAHLKKRAKDSDEVRALHEEVEALEASIEEREEQWKLEEKPEPVVTEEEIANVVESWTGIPVSRIVETESQKLLRMEEDLHMRIVGQHDAVVAVSKSVRRARSGLKDPKRPMGTFLFLGPTGV
ncbi:MAG: ATP-dependent Clp protease ATP-binding subunit ClpC, partial [Chloroflexota bacterium]